MNVFSNALIIVLIFYIGKRLSGSPDFKKLFSVVAFSLTPIIIGGAISDVLLHFPSILATLSGMGFDDPEFKSLGLIVYFGIFLPFAVWSFILRIKSIKIANNFGTGKAFGLVLIYGIITGLIGYAISFVI